MNLLYVQDHLTNLPASGGEILAFNELIELNRRAEVVVLNLVSDPGFQTPAEGALPCSQHIVCHRRNLDNYGLKNRLRSLLDNDPKLVSQYDWKSAFQKIEPVVSRTDTVFFGSPSGMALLRFEEVRRKRTRYLAMDVVHRLIRQMTSNYRHPRLAELDANRTEEFERSSLRLVEGAAALTQRDATSLSQLSGRDVAVLPPLYPPVAVEHRSEGFALIATNLRHPPSKMSLEWFLESVMPHLEGVSVVVTGRGDFDPYRPTWPSVDFRGFVSREQLDQLLTTAGVVLNPTIAGTGFQIKLLEALAYGCTVVSTEFSNPLGEAIPSSDDPEVFASMVRDALKGDGRTVIDYPALSEKHADLFWRFIEVGNESRAA